MQISMYFCSFIPLDTHLVHKDTQQKPYVRRDRDLPDTSWTQERELLQAWLLLALVFLLPLPVS